MFKENKISKITNEYKQTNAQLQGFKVMCTKIQGNNKQYQVMWKNTVKLNHSMYSMTNVHFTVRDKLNNENKYSVGRGEIYFVTVVLI